MEKKTVIFFLLCSMISSLFATDNLEDLDSLEQLEYELEKNPELRQKEIQESEINFNKLEELKKYDYYDTFIPKDRVYAPKQGPRFEPKPFRASLKSGAQLYSINGNNLVTTPRMMYVWAEEKVVGEDVVFIYNKKNKIVYQTDSKYIIPIESDLDMDARPKIFKIETPKENLTQAIDKNLRTNHLLSFHSQQLSDPFSASVFASYLNLNRNLNLTANATALEYQFFLPWNFPIDFGIISNYVSGSWKKEALGMHWKSLNIGPIIQKNFEIRKITKIFNFRASLGIMKSLFFNLKSDEVESKIEYSSLSTRLSLEALYKTAYGTLGLGPNYSLSKYSLTSADRAVQIDSQALTIKTIGLSFLYSFEVDL